MFSAFTIYHYSDYSNYSNYRELYSYLFLSTCLYSPGDFPDVPQLATSISKKKSVFNCGNTIAESQQH